MALEAGGMGPSVQGLAEMSVSGKTGVCLGPNTHVVASELQMALG